jgi:large subunit ribosomal protein L23
MSGPAFWESLVKAGRAVYFPNIPLRLVAPTAEAALKGLNVVTFITVPSTSKVRVATFFTTF